MTGPAIVHEAKPVLWQWLAPKIQFEHKWHQVMFAVKKSWCVQTNEI
jgi:hypothetical protein